MVWLWVILPILFLIGIGLNAFYALKYQDKWVEQYQKKKKGTPPSDCQENDDKP